MIRKLINRYKEKQNQIKPNELVLVRDIDGREVVGRIKSYTKKSIIIEVTKHYRLDANKVTIEKINT